MQNQALKAIKAAGCTFSRSEMDVAADLEKLQELLIKWQRVQNLVSRETLDSFWDRHVADSLQLLNYFPDSAAIILDLGSGGGFPALPLAIALKDRDIDFILIESNSRKVAFLRAVARELQLKVRVFDKRIGDIVSRETGVVDVITARALASLDKLCDFCFPLWSDDTRALFHKGREHVEEIAESSARWHHDVVIHPSNLERTGVILEMTHLRPKTS